MDSGRCDPAVVEVKKCHDHNGEVDRLVVPTYVAELDDIVLHHLRQLLGHLAREAQQRLLCFWKRGRFKIVQDASHQLFAAQHLRSDGGMRPPAKPAFVGPRGVGGNQLTQSAADRSGSAHYSLGKAGEMRRYFGPEGEEVPYLPVLTTR